uniref:Uncharacterized protein n=1 Tax=Candidatus Kentrum sp. FW TaxID=2126338 RepID=A0A450SNS1_9GAMM|nr:MAG: hypothetical protein BECKFW1821B_GA0114236_10235 [Candidatus Kentron sp. FW]
MEHHLAPWRQHDEPIGFDEGREGWHLAGAGNMGRTHEKESHLQPDFTLGNAFKASPKRRSAPSKHPERRLGNAIDGRSPGLRVMAPCPTFPVPGDQWCEMDKGYPPTVAGAARALDRMLRRVRTLFPFQVITGNGNHLNPLSGNHRRRRLWRR